MSCDEVAAAMTQGEDTSVNGARARMPGDGNLFCGVVAAAGTQGSNILPHAAAAIAAKTPGKNISSHGVVRTSRGGHLGQWRPCRDAGGEQLVPWHGINISALTSKHLGKICTPS